MKIKFRSQIVLALALAVAGTMAIAEDGAATYKAKCLMCHGAKGLAVGEGDGGVGSGEVPQGG